MTSARAETNRLADLLRREHHALADFLVALAAFHAERRWIELGHSSLFYFLHRELGLSKGAAHYRKVAAELVQCYPEIVDALRDGSLCMTSLVELSKVITPENRAEVLPRFFHLSKREAQEVTAELLPVPAPPLRTVVTALRAEALPEPSRDTPSEDGLLAALAPDPAAMTPGLANSEPAFHLANRPRASSTVHDVAAEPPRSPPPRPEVEPLTAELRRIHLTVSRRLLDKLAAARDALSHSHPGASEDEILEVGLDLILQRHARRRGLGTKPRKPAGEPKAPVLPAAGAERAAPPVSPPPGSPPSERSRHVPAHVEREVWERDQGRCRWPLDGGGFCGETYQVQTDHIDGWALGADHDPERMRLLCRVHQDVHARRLYGDALMDRYTGPKGEGCSEPVAEYAPGRRPTWEGRAETAQRSSAPDRPSERHRAGVDPRGWRRSPSMRRSKDSATSCGPGTRQRSPRAAPLRPEPFRLCPPGTSRPVGGGTPGPRRRSLVWCLGGRAALSDWHWV